MEKILGHVDDEAVAPRSPGEQKTEKLTKSARAHLSLMYSPCVPPARNKKRMSPPSIPFICAGVQSLHFQMKRRIKQLIARPLSPVTFAQVPEAMSPELLDAILLDLDAGRTQTYEQIAGKVGCSVSKIQSEAKNQIGILRTSKPHRVPDTVYRLLVARLVMPHV